MPQAFEYCLFGIDWWPVCMNKAEWASWVQAIGSIGAILGTAWAVHWAHGLQVRQGRRDSFDTYTQFLVSLHDLVTVSVNLGKEICETGSPFDSLNQADREMLIAELETIRDALGRFELGRLDRTEFLDAWRLADAWVRRLIACVKSLPTDHHELLELAGLRVLAGPMAAQLAPYAEALKDGIALRGGPRHSDVRP